MADDREFFDILYSAFAKTTGAEDTYWMPEYNTVLDNYDVYAVGQDESREWVGSFNDERDADFITAVHGCLPDLVRRLHDALDEADRLDRERDEQERRYAEAIIRQQELQEEIQRLQSELIDGRAPFEVAMEAMDRARVAEDKIDELRSKAADVLWKTERPM